ncbi:hypothetical protein RclHR1_01660012 [Rhizophagus clarus]|nr:hypothetical protein RclHR1_01660012 [Rhizophagus clarus]
MIVEIIANKKDRKHVANYLNYDIERRDPSSCICYIEFIKNCMFEWDDSMTGVLWPLGDYLNEASKVSQTHQIHQAN